MTTHKEHRRTLRGRLARIPLIPAALFGVVAVAALPASQAFSIASNARTERTHSVTTRGQALLDLAPGLPPKSATPQPSTTKATATPSKPARKPAPAPPAKKELAYAYAAQINGWYCGPAAARIALTTRHVFPSQDNLAGRLGTTMNGTNSSQDIARVLNALTQKWNYQATSIPTKSPSNQQVNQLRANVVRAISHGYGVVANVSGGAQDVKGNWYSFPGGHYIAVMGYQNKGGLIKIADPANPYAASYWMTALSLAQWVGTRGYAA
jgi:hypothetical protein